MFNAITGALSSSGKTGSLRMRSITGKPEDTIEHKNKIIDALTAELTQKVHLIIMQILIHVNVGVRIAYSLI